MHLKNVSSLKQKMLLIGVITIAFLFVSSATLVPQTQGAAVNDQIDTMNQQKDLITFFENIQNNEKITEQQQLNVVYLLMNVFKKMTSSEEMNENNLISTMQQESSLLEETTITTEDVKKTTSEVMTSLQNTLTEEMTNENIPQEQGIVFNLFKNLLTKLLSRIVDIDAFTGEGLLDIISTLFGMFTGLPSLLLKILGQGVSLIFKTFARIIRAIISMVLLFVGGIQLALLIGGLFFMFLGFASKIGIKAFSFVGAPLFAVIAVLFTLATGTLIGGSSLLLNFAVGFLITFAIPIGLIILVISLITDEDTNINFNLGGNEDGLLYMLASIIASIFNPSTA